MLVLRVLLLLLFNLVPFSLSGFHQFARHLCGVLEVFLGGTAKDEDRSRNWYIKMWFGNAVTLLVIWFSVKKQVPAHFRRNFSCTKN